jgi:hypothetical protein
VGRRRRIAQGIATRADAQRAQPVHRLTQRADDAAQPVLARVNGIVVAAEFRAAAGADASQGAIWHQQTMSGVEADHFGERPLAIAVYQPTTITHRESIRQPLDFEQEPSDPDNASIADVSRQPVQPMRETCGERGCEQVGHRSGLSFRLAPLSGR